jgi:chloramphenicol-sensitive protein RarD
MPPHPRHVDRTGVAYASAAYATWGLFPIYFRLLAGVPAREILAHRIVWSAAFLVALLSALRQWRDVARALRTPGALRTLAATALLISSNWLVYIWAVNSGRVLDASLGYFVNPLVTVLLGVAFLRDRLSAAQKVAVAIAAAGVGVLVVSTGRVPWIAMALALTFGLYGLLRKRLQVDALSGLFAEVALLAPAALLYLGWIAAHDGSHFRASARVTALLAASGVVTAIPLLWFAAGVQRLRLSTVGVLQYLNPTIQFAIAVFAFREPFTRATAVAFACIWTSLAIYTADAFGVAGARRSG